MRAHVFSNFRRHPPPDDLVRKSIWDDFLPHSTPEHRVGAFRGMLIAVAMAVPFWLALYLLLRRG